MDKMFVRVPVAVKAKVTEDLKLKIIGDVQETIKKMDLELEHFEFQAKKALAQAAGDLSVLPALRSQIDAERSKRQAAKAEAEARLKRAQDLEIGAEIGHGTLERTVEVTIGTDLDALARALMDKQICIGTIVAPHGVRGDIRILPQTEHPEQFLDLDYLLLDDGRTLHLTNARFHKRMALVKCREVNNMNEAELLRGKNVFIRTEDLPELEEGEFYVADLLGCKVIDTAGAEIGELKDVISTGSNDVYVVKTAGAKELLVPALKQHVKEINPEERRIVVELPEWVDEK